MSLELINDGLRAYGSGVWLFHDHQNQGVTTDGIGPGGNISAIVYKEYLQESGWPNTLGVSMDKYFTKAYYRREVPVWEDYAPGLFSQAGNDPVMFVRVIVLALSLGIVAALLLSSLLRRRA